VLGTILCLSLLDTGTIATGTTTSFHGMVQVTGEFPEPGLSVGNMGLSSVAFLFGILSYGVLAA